MFIYFIRAGDAIKIGIANDIRQRLRDLQVGNPIKLELSHSEETDEETAHIIEAELHNIFSKTRLSGEWFHYSWFMTAFIDNIKKMD